MRPAITTLSKGDAVEEWVDLKFFRPVGARIARSFARTTISADQVTMMALIVGLVAGHLFFYSSVALNLLGFALFVISDIFDSVDGQLARLRGDPTRWGKIVDGIGDSLRWTNLYVHLILRLALGNYGIGAEALAVAAFLSHTFHAAGIDFIRSAYLEVALGERGAVDLPEKIERTSPRNLPRWLAHRLYRIYVARQSWMFPNTIALIRTLQEREASGEKETRSAYADRQIAVVRQCAWLGHNIRFGLLALLPWIGGVEGFLCISLVPMSALFLSLAVRQERNVLALPLPVAAPSVAPAP